MTTPPAPDRPSPRARWRKRAGTAIRALVSFGLLVYLFSKVGWRAVVDELQQADPVFLAAYVALGLLAILVSAAKWQVLCRACGIIATLPRLFLLYLVGNFFNHILPTSVGGDVVRAVALGRREGKVTEALASTFVERFTGLSILLVFAIIGVSSDARFRTDLRVIGLLMVVIAGYVVGTWMVFSPTALTVARRINRLQLLDKGFAKIEKVQQAIRMYRHHKPQLVIAVLYSIAFYAITVLIVYTGCLIFDVRDVSILALFAAVPVMHVIFLIPISLGGIGFQEWAYFSVLEIVGVPSAVGLSLGLVYRARAVLFGLIGGIVYPFLVRRDDRSSVAGNTDQSAPT